MADIITTLHPEGSPGDNLYPNVKLENLPQLPKEEIARGSYSVTTSLRYTTCSFTLTKKMLVRVSQVWINESPTAIAICNTNTGNTGIITITSAPSGFTPGKLECQSLLEPGTYYIWASALGNVSNLITVTGYNIY
jgi:hypothetical protein